MNLEQPGPIDTELNSADVVIAKDNRSHTALDRYGTTEELAAVVLFLARAAASYVIGSVFTADGGFNV